MTKYEIIFEELQERVDNGILTTEDAEIINDLAYDKYVVESQVLEIKNLKIKRSKLIDQKKSCLIKTPTEDFIKRRLIN